jgi:hypothetical protein
MNRLIAKGSVFKLSGQRVAKGYLKTGIFAAWQEENGKTEKQGFGYGFFGAFGRLFGDFIL